MTAARCPGCPDGMRDPGKYLCRTCWFALPDSARRLLNRVDSRAFARLRQLHQQLDAGTPVTEIRITT